MDRYSSKSARINRVGLLLILIALLLASCNIPISQDTGQATATQSAFPTDTPFILATDVPPALSVLLVHSSIDEAIVASVLQVLEQKTDALGWFLDVQEELSSGSLPETVQWVILLGPVSNATELIESSFPTPFLAIGTPGLGDAPNISRLAPDGFRLDQLGFVSGHLASVITDEWRIGLIMQTDEQQAAIFQQSYINGRSFYCGICQLSYPPFLDYPISVVLNPAAGNDDWDAALQLMLDNAVRTVFVYADVIPDEILDRSFREGITMLGTPLRPENASGNWAASVNFDLTTALQERWDPSETDIGWTASVPLAIRDIDPALLSPGRLRWVDDLRLKVEEGAIDPAVTPVPNLSD